MQRATWGKARSRPAGADPKASGGAALAGTVRNLSVSPPVPPHTVTHERDAPCWQSESGIGRHLEERACPP